MGWISRTSIEMGSTTFVPDMLPRYHRQRMIQMGTSLPAVATVSRIESRPQDLLSTLFLNRGDGTYAEIGQLAGLRLTGPVPSSMWTSTAGRTFSPLWARSAAQTGRDGPAQGDVGEGRMSDAQIFGPRLFPRLDSPFLEPCDLTFEESGANGVSSIAGCLTGWHWRIWIMTVISTRP